MMDVSEEIIAAQNGQRAAFDLLYEEFYQPVFRYIWNKVYNFQDAEDLTQETFIRTWINIRKYKDQGIPFSHFLFRVAHNAVVDHQRRDKHLVFVEDLDFNMTDGKAEELIELRMDLHNLTSFLRRLPEDYQKVLVQRFFSGMSPKETAKSMRRTEVATRILQHRALVAVRDLALEEN